MCDRHIVEELERQIDDLEGEVQDLCSRLRVLEKERIQARAGTRVRALAAEKLAEYEQRDEG